MDAIFERILLLKRVPFFEVLRTDQLSHVAALLEQVGWVTGEIAFVKGDMGDHMYIITSGRIGISLSEDWSAKDFVAEFSAGECFGEMGVLDDLARSATAHVLENTEAFTLSRDKLHGLLLTYPELGVGMLRAMSRRLRQANSALLARSTSLQKPKK
jgi:CRP/FNR family transcriptional regulator, cyclic AMP receptor protein